MENRKNLSLDLKELRVGAHKKPLQRSETWTDVIHFVDLSEDSSSSVLNKLQLSERRKQHKNGDIIKTSKTVLRIEIPHNLTLMSTSVL